MVLVSVRLARTLVKLAKEDGADTHGRVIRQRPTQQELANMVGAVRESVTLALGRLAAARRHQQATGVPSGDRAWIDTA